MVPDEYGIVRAANDLAVSSAGDSFFIPPELRDIFESEQLVFERTDRDLSLLQLKLKIDAAAVDDQLNVPMFPEKILSENDITDMNGIVFVTLEMLSNSAGQLFRFPMLNRRR